MQSRWDQSILQLRFLTAQANRRRVKVIIEKEGLKFSRFLDDGSPDVRRRLNVRNNVGVLIEWAACRKNSY